MNTYHNILVKALSKNFKLPISMNDYDEQV